MLKSIIFLVNSFLGKFYRHLAIFSGHTATYILRITFSPSISSFDLFAYSFLTGGGWIYQQCQGLYVQRQLESKPPGFDPWPWERITFQCFSSQSECLKGFRNMLFKWAHPWLFFIYFRLFKQTIQFLQQINVKNVKISIHYIAPGFEPATFRTWVVAHNH